MIETLKIIAFDGLFVELIMLKKAYEQIKYYGMDNLNLENEDIYEIV